MYACVNARCGRYKTDTTDTTCPTCHQPTSTLRSQVFECGGCTKQVVLDPRCYPIQECGWGHVQLSARHDFNYLCTDCSTVVEKRFPALSRKKDAALQIVRPSKG